MTATEGDDESAAASADAEEGPSPAVARCSLLVARRSAAFARSLRRLGARPLRARGRCLRRRRRRSAAGGGGGGCAARGCGAAAAAASAAAGSPRLRRGAPRARAARARAPRRCGPVPRLAAHRRRASRNASSRWAAARESASARAAGALGLARRQTLVVHGRRARRRARRAVSAKRAGPAGLLALLPAHRERQADHDLVDLAISHEAGEGIESAPCIRARATASSGVTTVSVGSQTAQPQRASPASSARMRIRRAASRSPRAPRRARPAACPGPCRRPARAVGRPPPPPPAISRGDADHVARVEPALDRRRREVRDQVHAPVRRRAEHDRAVAELLAQLVGQGEQRLRLGDLGHLGDARGLRRPPRPARRAAPPARGRRPRASACAGLLQLTPAACARRSPPRAPARAASRQSRAAPRSGARNSSIPPSAVSASIRRTFDGARGLVRDVEEADLGGRGDVRAAAELARDALDVDHPHPVAVLLAEQRHRPEPLGLLAASCGRRAPGGSRRSRRSPRPRRPRAPPSTGARRA